ncbi:hypothetical protein [Primorskyibacter flagellatus]|uniref:hypothetical protein n=1 Tax=Primorskyibacter flagellatus TaxID=1387277 RepID=UPI003A93D26E
MRPFFVKLFSTPSRHLPGVISLFFTFLLFLSVSGYFIEEKSALDKLFATGTGFFAGMVGGGVLGWVIGGFGVVAMGTGVGVGALGAIAIGATVGALFGGLTGASFSFVQMLRNPSDFDVNWLGLVLALLVSAIVFFCFKLALLKVPTLLRRGSGKNPKLISHER